MHAELSLSNLYFGVNNGFNDYDKIGIKVGLRVLYVFI